MRGVLQQDCLLRQVTSQGFGNAQNASKGKWCYLDSFLCSGVHSPCCMLQCKFSTVKKGLLCSYIVRTSALVYQKNLKGSREPQQLASDWRLLHETRAFSAQTHGFSHWEAPEEVREREYQVIWIRFLTERTRDVKIKRKRKFVIRWSCLSWWLIPPDLLKSVAPFILFAGENGTE